MSRLGSGASIFLIFFSIAGSTFSQQKTDGGTRRLPLTNYAVFSAQVDSLSDSVAIALFRFSKSSANLLQIRTDSREIDNFVRRRIEERLLKDGIQIVMDSTAPVTLRVEVPFVNVTYSAPISSHIFGSSELVRSMRSAYDVEITDSGRVEFAKTFTFSFADTISQSQISELEEGSYEFLKGTSDPARFIDTIFQPFLFAASAAVIVYLFFTLRGS
jgi:hypothetical protein